MEIFIGCVDDARGVPNSLELMSSRSLLLEELGVCERGVCERGVCEAERSAWVKRFCEVCRVRGAWNTEKPK